MHSAAATTKLWLNILQRTKGRWIIMIVYWNWIGLLNRQICVRSILEVKLRLNIFNLWLFRAQQQQEVNKFKQLRWYVITKLHRLLPAWHAYYSAFSCSRKSGFVVRLKEKTFPFWVGCSRLNMALACLILPFPLQTTSQPNSTSTPPSMLCLT